MPDPIIRRAECADIKTYHQATGPRFSDQITAHQLLVIRNVRAKHILNYSTCIDIEVAYTNNCSFSVIYVQTHVGPTTRSLIINQK